MDKIISNWSLIILALSALIIAFSYITKFIQKPTSQQILQLKEILLYWTALAEKELGSGTGKLKLRYVYELFITKFESLSKIISFEQFSKIVDEVLEDMRKLLSENKKAQEYVGVEQIPKGEEKEKTTSVSE